MARLSFRNKRVTDMNLNCAILHADKGIVQVLEEFIGKVPFLSLCGAYDHPLEALRAYYENKVEVYFVGIGAGGEEPIDGMDFCRMLSLPTRVIFVADTERHAAGCFRLDALDYLTVPFDFSVFFQSVSKAARWFSLQASAAQSVQQEAVSDACPPSEIYIRADNRIIRLVLTDIAYVEALGDYVKIYCRGESHSILSLCSLKCMEERLPADDFIRVHRSFLVRKACIDTIGRNTLMVGTREIPIGNAYREQVRRYVARLSVL